MTRMGHSMCFLVGLKASHLHDVGMEIMENATTEAREHVGVTAWHTQHAVPGACVNEKDKGSLA